MPASRSRPANSRSSGIAKRQFSASTKGSSKGGRKKNTAGYLAYMRLGRLRRKSSRSRSRRSAWKPRWTIWLRLSMRIRQYGKRWVMRSIPSAVWRLTSSFDQIPNVNQNEKICWEVRLGLIPYELAYDLQRKLVQARKEDAIPDVLLLCEHPHVITLGRNGQPENLLASNHLLAQMNVEFHATDRGGDITYHGPGQIVGYPILDLAKHRRDVRWYVNQLEEVMIRATADFGLGAKRVEGQHGVWIDTGASTTEEKLGALGVHLSRWVTSHGFAYNVSTDLRYFDLIVPCGIAGKRAVSLERALGRNVDSGEVMRNLISHFGRVFERTMISISPSELETMLDGDRFSAGPLVREQENVPVGVAKGSQA